MGLVYKKEENSIEGYTDADWACDKTDRKSVSGAKIFCGNLVGFLKKQSCTALYCCCCNCSRINKSERCDK